MHPLTDPGLPFAARLRRSWVMRYGCALFVVALALLLMVAIPPIRVGTPFLFFFLAVVVSTWVGGLGPGLLSIGLSALCVILWGFPPYGTFFLSPWRYAQLLGFLIVAGLLVWLVFVLERALRRANAQRELLRITMASIGDAVITTDIVGNITLMNGAALALTGWQPDTTLGKPLDEVIVIVNEQSRLPIVNPIHEVLASGKSVGLANHSLLIAKDGAAYPIDDRAAPIRNEVGQLIGAVLVLRDISERRQSEAALRKSEEQFRVAQELSLDAFTLLDAIRDPQGQVIDFQWRYANPVAARVLKRSRPELEGQRLLDVLPGNQNSSILFTAYVQVVETGRPHDLEICYQDDGIDGWFRNVCVKLDDGVAVYFSDITARKQAEAALLASEQEFRAVFELAGSGKAQVDPASGCFVRVNRKFCEITGYTEAELLTRTYLDITHPEDQDRDQMVTAPILRGEQDYWTSEKRYIRKDGQVIWVLVTGALLRDSQGRPFRTVATIHDITARKQYETQLAYYALLLENMQDAVIGSDLDFRITAWNHGAEQLYGWTAAEVLGHAVRDVIGSMLTEEQRAYSIHELMSTGRCRSEVVTYHRTGNPIQTDSIVTTLYSDAKQIIGYVAINRDIGVLKRVEAQLRERVEEMETLLDLLPVAVFIAHDPKGQRITGNRAGYDLLRLPAGANISFTGPLTVHGMTVELYQEGEPVDPTALPLQYALQHGVEVRNAEVDFVYDDGTLLNIYGYAKPLFNEQGNVRGGLAVFIDISERKRAEKVLQELNTFLDLRVRERTAELERSNRDLDQFAYVASHDLKSPLRGIDHLASWISEDAADLLPATSKEHLAKLRKRIVRMEKLLDDLLAYSRAGRHRHPPEPVHTASLVQEVVEFLALPPGFTVHIAEAMPTLTTERTPLETVFRNLLGNAYKHHDHPAEGCAWVAATEQGDWIEFTVTDNGPGVAPEHHARIFQIFQTLKPRDQVEGSGIGLTVVQRLIESRGGQIQIQSQVGEGATLRFTWPKNG